MTVYLHSLGCDKNLVDSEVMLGLLFDAGYKHAVDPSQADIIVVNTCGFIQEAVEEGIDAVLEMAAYKEPSVGRCKKLVVTGCMAQRYREEIVAEIPEIDDILGANDFPKIAEIARMIGDTGGAITGVDGEANAFIAREANACIAGTGDIDIFDDELFEKRARTMPIHVAYVKISEGCDNRCTYCTIPLIKGAYRDRKFESIIKECKHLVKSGARELVLVAQDTAKYGLAMYNRQRLHELLEAIVDIDGLSWVRVMYAYPEHVYPELIDTLAGSTVLSRYSKICNYLDMPIQHSHDDVISRMGRKMSNQKLRNLITQLQKRGITIRTTLIAGFPGETEEEFEHLRRFIQDIKFDHLGVFAYSREDKTPAAVMEPQIKTAVKNVRRDELMALQAQIAEERCRDMVGQTLHVMVDGSVDGGMRLDGGINVDNDNAADDIDEIHDIIYCGRSKHDAYDIDGAVFFPAQQEFVSGDWATVKITKSHGYDLYGELVQV